MTSHPGQPPDGRRAEIGEIAENLQAGVDIERNFQRLFDFYFERLCYFFQRRGCHPQDSHDLTQECLLRVYKGVRGFRKESNLDTWILKIAANIWRNELRSRSASKREGQVVPLGAPGESPSDLLARSHGRNALDKVLWKERRRSLRGVLAELPARMRQCLLLRIDQELKYREIAGILQLSIDTVKSQIYEGKRRLKQLIDGDLSQES